MGYFQSEETVNVLNAVGENIFICDSQFTVIFINRYAEQLIQRLSPFTGLSSKEEFIGKNIADFHQANGSRQRRILANGPFPFCSRIVLFDKYTANIVVNPFTYNKDSKGFMLTWKDVTVFEEEINKGQSMMEEMYAPIIKTILDDVLLLPITGFLSEERLHKIKEKALYESSDKQASYMVIDFTGVTSLDNEFIVAELEIISQSLALLGTEAIYTGLSTTLVRQIVSQGTKIKNETFASYNQAMQQICKIKGYQLVPYQTLPPA